MSSTGALALPDIPETLLVVGGGYVGVELGSVYASLGSKVTLVEMADRLMAGADKDLVKPLLKKLEESFEAIHTQTKVSSMQEEDDGVKVTFEGGPEESEQRFDRVLVAIGRRPNSSDIGLDKTGVETDDKGFIKVDEKRRTADKRIYAVGDVVGGVMLAHKGMYEGKVAADVIAGEPSAFDVQAIPAVVYTDPQIAWCGLTEAEAKEQGRNVKVGRFPWSASGRAASMGLRQGLTKMIVDAETERVLGVGIVGREAGEMISEGVLAVEMGALAEDLALSIHPHPTLSEGEEEAAEAFLGKSTHILPRKKKQKG
jgi:dihydrolipoamide dehydrogenase